MLEGKRHQWPGHGLWSMQDRGTIEYRKQGKCGSEWQGVVNFIFIYDCTRFDGWGVTMDMGWDALSK